MGINSCRDSNPYRIHNNLYLILKNMEIQIQNPTFISTRLHHSHNKSKNLLFFRLAKKKRDFFLLMISSQITTTKKFYTLHNENDDDPDADFSQLLMGLCIGLPSRQILIKNLNFLFWCSIWGMKCSTKSCCQNFQLMGIRLPCFTRSMKVSVSICG